MKNFKPLQSRYVTDARRYPLLTKEEEAQLIVRKSQGDIEARNKLVEGNLRLAMMLAMQYKRSGLPIEDLVQAANVGLIRGVDHYEDGHGAKLGYYCAYWIHESLKKMCMAEKSLVKIGTTTTQKKLFSNLYKKVDDICSFNKEQIAIDLQVSVKDVEEMCARLRPDVRVDINLHDKDGERYADRLISSLQSPEEALNDSSDRELLELILEKSDLEDVEKEIVMARHSEQPEPYRDLSARLGLSVSVVRKHYLSGLAKMKQVAAILAQ